MSSRERSIIRPFTLQTSSDCEAVADLSLLITPGDVITNDTDYMRGHGTYVNENQLCASVAGVIERVNRLISVHPYKSRYIGQIGDVVVGRIIQVAQRRWKVDTKSKLDSVLMLSSVNLPGGELRRRDEEDELLMRDYLSEGDLISAEVQTVFSDGALSLHTRSLKYGKLCQGVLVDVPCSLIKRRKTHFHTLPCGASVILGNNGYVWISPTTGHDENSSDSASSGGGFVQNLEPVPTRDKEVIARLRNCILALAEHNMMVYDTSVMYAFEASAPYQAHELLRPEVAKEIVELSRQRLELES